MVWMDVGTSVTGKPVEIDQMGSMALVWGCEGGHTISHYWVEFPSLLLLLSPRFFPWPHCFMVIVHVCVRTRVRACACARTHTHTHTPYSLFSSLTASVNSRSLLRSPGECQLVPLGCAAQGTAFKGTHVAGSWSLVNAAIRCCCPAGSCTLFETPWTVAHPAPRSLGSPR